VTYVREGEVEGRAHRKYGRRGTRGAAKYRGQRRARQEEGGKGERAEASKGKGGKEGRAEERHEKGDKQERAEASKENIRYGREECVEWKEVQSYRSMCACSE
jgi:hypothetical protein